ncbi:glutaredoxin-C9-like [Gastrolobium bilobum]|uniref:glutaredoxin-C9-like n=1 Tax=Gastrolobium bilobum TaxID=150636 RepID=UPI002AB0E858|nr:glutaredoxin-C9-like [Gastrolobium bilobum]
MHQAIPYKSWITAGTRDSRDLPVAGGIQEANGGDPSKAIRMVSENAVIIIGRRGCCMCHVVKRLLQGLGVNPPVYEVDDDHEPALAAHLSTQPGCGVEALQFPAVFVGGKLFGGLERVMATHISGELVPILKDAGALWL